MGLILVLALQGAMKMSEIMSGRAQSQAWVCALHIGACIVVIRLPQWLNGKKSSCNAGDVGSIPGTGRSPGGGCGNPLQYCCLGKPMDRGAWQAIVHEVVKSQIRLSAHTHRLVET